MKRIHLFVRGRVQGVFYRATAAEYARALDLKGWVRNADDGSVELLVEGHEAALNLLRRWCRQGPPGAHVDQIEAIEEPATGEFRSFHVRD